MPTGVKMAKALQRNGCMSTIQSDMGAAVADRHIDVTVQIRQGMAFKIKLVMTGHEVLDDVSANFIIRDKRRHVVRRAVHHGCATGVRIAGASVRKQRMTADETGKVRTAHHRRAVAANVISDMYACGMASGHQAVMT